LNKVKEQIQRGKVFLYEQLPLIAAVLLEGHIRFYSLGSQSALEYVSINCQLFFESMLLFIAHYFSSRSTFIKGSFIWLAGFLIYPLIVISTQAQSSAFEAWSLFSIQGWLLLIVGSAIQRIQKQQQRHLANVHSVNHQLESSETEKSSKTKNANDDTSILGRLNNGFNIAKNGFNKLLSLNGLVAITLVIWAVGFSGVLNTHIDPMLNQPFDLLIDVGLIFSQFTNFIRYLWQIAIIAVLLYLLFLFNRYLLIRVVLTQHGIIDFLIASLISVLILTPIGISILLLLPINELPADIQNLTPGGDNNIFHRYNYQFTVLFFLFTTPVILAFERQQHHAELTESLQRQIQTELQLLQQQIQPHFLFNTLNNLYALTLNKSDDAPELVMQLSKLLRYTVYEGQKQKVPLNDEIDYLKNFIALHRIRRDERCEYDFQWPEKTPSLSISPLLLIILLENAIKHGVEPKEHSTWLKFSLDIQDKLLTVRCENPIHSEECDQPKGVGLINLKKRLTLLYPDRHELNISTEKGIWSVTLKLELEPC